MEGKQINTLMSIPSGVSIAYKKDCTKYYRASITYKNKHISLGSFNTADLAAMAYELAKDILNNGSCYNVDTNHYTISYPSESILPFPKWVSLINFRDHHIYIKTPIYLCNKHFIYFLAPTFPMLFDVDDLFFYSTHTILYRNGYYYVNDYGMQINILSRYGIKNHAVSGRDYIFANGDCHDFRYQNLMVLNKYTGVQSFIKKGKTFYKSRIHVKSTYVIGIYPTEKEAAVAYNKAADLLLSKGLHKNFTYNYIEEISSIEYASLYHAVKISKKLREISF